MTPQKVSYVKDKMFEYLETQIITGVDGERVAVHSEGNFTEGNATEEVYETMCIF